MAVHLSQDEERHLIRDFFGGRPGYFVEVGANDPYQHSQTWHLEQRGWDGVLIEPQPALAERLKAERRAQVFAAACSSPERAGRTVSLYVAGAQSTLDRDSMSPGHRPDGVIDVPARTLDDILTEARSPAPLDFLSVDVEGHEIEVLRGFDIARWRPRLILLEDHVVSLDKHRYLKARGYRLIRRTIFNGWYVPADQPVLIGWRTRIEIMRKYYLALPVRWLRDRLRRTRDGARS